MKRIIYHIALPAIACLLFFAVARTPVSFFGCANRGLLATAIALSSGVGAIVSIIRCKNEMKPDPEAARWWLMTTLILAVPLVGLVILA
ncbi:MAG: hypothetical protein EG826_06385 [Deltaproteobacteria bacterium]|nr:hypothetical protein [Deltaproteobacteria bacterium]